MLIKKALKGDLPLIAAARTLQDEIMSPSMSMPDDWTIRSPKKRARWPRSRRSP